MLWTFPKGLVTMERIFLDYKPMIIPRLLSNNPVRFYVCWKLGSCLIDMRGGWRNNGDKVGYFLYLFILRILEARASAFKCISSSDSKVRLCGSDLFSDSLRRWLYALFKCNQPSPLLIDIVYFGPLCIAVSLTVLKRVY